MNTYFNSAIDLESLKYDFIFDFLEDQVGDTSAKSVDMKSKTLGSSPAKRKNQATETAWLPWTEKYKPKVPNDIIGNQSLVCFYSLTC